MRIAVASKDGRLIDQHFGHAERFLVYDVDKNGIRFVDERKVEKYCTGPETDYERLGAHAIYDSIKDCSAVLVSRIGPAPEEKLKKMGIMPIVIYDFIHEGLLRAAGLPSGERRYGGI